MPNWTKEKEVDNYVRRKLEALSLRANEDFRQDDASACLKEALQGGSKTEKQSGEGKPDFTCEKYAIPVLIESKLNLTKLEKLENSEVSQDKKAIRDYATNGAIHYAKTIIKNGKYKEAIAIGVAGDNEENIKIKAYFVMANAHQALNISDFNFLENQKAFDELYKTITLSEEEKHRILTETLKELSTQSKGLNKLMHSCNITAPQRVLYVSGMLLSMQSYGSNLDSDEGLMPNDLKGAKDGKKIVARIKEYLEYKKIPQNKLDLMLASFNEISKDTDRDKPQTLNKEVAKLLTQNASINKQIFAFIYENIFKRIDKYSTHLDFIGELYSEFLKYALGDGKELGIVLTPPYVTKMMSELLEIDFNSRVMDLATGSAGFLISSMQQMIESANARFTKKSNEAKAKIKEIKAKQLLGIELNAEMFALATTNMILRGDGSSQIYKGDSHAEILKTTIKDFKADRLLLNPPFTYAENGMPFIKLGLDNMPKHAKGAIIIQDSAGSGKAIKTNQALLESHTLLASIKMPVDLFQPMAGVQTSIYIFEAGIPHDYEKPVKFIDFRNDGFKRTGRALLEIDNPKQRYADIVKIYKQGLNAKINNELYKEPIKLEQIYIEDFISDSGKDWNFEAHQKIDTKPTLEDFKKCVSDYLSWEVSQILKGQNANF